MGTACSSQLGPGDLSGSAPQPRWTSQLRGRPCPQPQPGCRNLRRGCWDVAISVGPPHLQRRGRQVTCPLHFWGQLPGYRQKDGRDRGVCGPTALTHTGTQRPGDGLTCFTADAASASRRQPRGNDRLQTVRITAKYLWSLRPGPGCSKASAFGPSQADVFLYFMDETEQRAVRSCTPGQMTVDSRPVASPPMDGVAEVASRALAGLT